MKLLIVTGISELIWKEWTNSIEIPHAQVSTELQSVLEGLQTKSNKNEIKETLNGILSSLDAQKPQCVFLPDCLAQLPVFLEHDSVKSLIFYSDPEYSVAHTLSDTSVGEDDALKVAQLWQQQLKMAYSVFRTHRQTCLLVSGHDVVANQSQSLPSLSDFCQTKVTYKNAAASVSTDKLLAAQLILQDQDALFDFYDEIKSDAPTFGPFTVSGVTASQLSSLALKAIKQRHSAQEQQVLAAQKQVSRLASVEQELLNNNNQLLELKQQKEQLENHRSDLAKKLEGLEKERANLASQAQQLGSDNELQVQHLNKLQEELEATHKELAEQTKQVQQLTNKLQEQTAHATQENEVQVLQLNQLQDELEATHKERAEQTKQVQQLTKKLQEQTAHATQENELQVLQLNQLQEELEATHKERAELTKQVQQLTNKLQEQTAHATQENEVQVQQLNQLQDELEATHKERAEQTKQVEQLTNKLQEQTAHATQENEVQVLQLNQLQEELEATHKERAELTKQVQQLTNKLQEQTAHAAQAKQESELQVLQINQLQDELESSHLQLKDTQQKVQQVEKQLAEQKSHFASADAEHKKQVAQLTRQNEKLNQQSASAQAKTAGSIQQLETVKGQLQHSEAESELLILQTAQLQEELESTYLKLEQVKDDTHAANSQSVSHQKASLLQQGEIDNLVAENEIATLQVNQLQEELEFYYQQLQQKESAQMLHSHPANKPIQRVFDKSALARAEIVSGYTTDGYSDIQLRLENVALADGRLFEAIMCKLINVEGRVGIEFRAADPKLEFRWLDDLSDDYGYFITYIPNPPESKAQQQQLVDEKLNASERVAVLGVASLLTDALQLDDLFIAKPMEEGELRDWRLSAIELKNQIAALPQWMSFDQLSLVEEYRTDDYEHLWLRFSQLLVNDQLFPEFEVKFAATGNPFDALFTDEITLELRATPAGFGPLQAWPPTLKDDYGYKFQAKVALGDENLEIVATDKTSQRDKQLIRHLFKNFMHFMPVLNAKGAQITRDNNDWLAVGELLANIGVFAETNQQIENEMVTNPTPFIFTEVVDLGGYQHLVFEFEIQPETTLKLKVRANNIDESGNADIAIELRTGDELVPLASSRYFAEDDYGPRVLFDLDDAEELIFDDTLEAEQRELLSEFMQALPALISATSELDEQAQLLWSEWLQDK